jgi:hypothetical protein
MCANIIREVFENLQFEVVIDLGSFADGGARELEPLGMILLLNLPKSRRDWAAFTENRNDE